MRLQLLMCAGLLCMGLSGCNKEVTRFPKSDHYILRYQNPSSMYAETKSAADTPPIGSTPAKVTDGHFVVYTRPYSSPALSESKDLVDDATFETLAERFGDTHFGGTTIDCLSVPVMYVQTESVNIVSDNDYDADHPAGSSLNDLFVIQYKCVDNILKKPYDFEPTDEQQKWGLPAWCFAEKVSDFNLRRPTLLQFNFIFSPVTDPDRSGIHRFTITWANIEGKVLSATTQPVQLAGKSL